MTQMQRIKLISLGALMIGVGIWVIWRGGDPERPSDDSRVVRWIGGLVMIGFGLVVAAIGVAAVIRGDSGAP